MTLQLSSSKQAAGLQKNDGGKHLTAWPPSNLKWTLVLLAALFSPMVIAQGIDDSSSLASAGVDDLRPVAHLVEPLTIGDRFNAVLGGVNDIAFKTLFVDISFGAFRGPVADDAGQPVREAEPVMIDVETQFRGVLVDDTGQPILAAGERQEVEVPAGSRVQQVRDGRPVFVDGEIKIAGPELPFLVVFLAAGALFYTLYHGFINIRGFGHAIAVVRGKWTAGADEGDVSPFQAFTAALSATVGLGNIASVAVAMVAGGPGALFWMMVLGLFGMTSKFHESTLAQMYRIKNADGTVSGGPMFYLDLGLRQLHPALGGWARRWRSSSRLFLHGRGGGRGQHVPVQSSLRRILQHVRAAACQRRK